METTVYGKWILTGEHAVLRGAPALVFPVFAKALQLRFLDESFVPLKGATGSFSGTSNSTLQVGFEGEYGSELNLLFHGVVEKGASLCGRKIEEVRGAFVVHNSIPIGAGLGASAALCVAVGRWFHSRGWVRESEVAEFARQLENLFHGESSGVDIAVALTGCGLHFERGGRRYALEPGWRPNWYLSYSGKRGVTSECVARVKDLWSLDPSIGASIDRDMVEASRKAERALAMDSSKQGLPLLTDAIDQAGECFAKWGLADGRMGEHLAMLRAAGAVAVKPTGSGDGGFALSLWSEPPRGLCEQLIEL